MPTSARADACYRKMSEEIGARGMFVGRAPVDYRDLRMRRAMPAFAMRARASKSRSLPMA
jgi:hypothetical protein